MSELKAGDRVQHKESKRIGKLHHEFFENTNATGLAIEYDDSPGYVSTVTNPWGVDDLDQFELAPPSTGAAAS